MRANVMRIGQDHTGWWAIVQFWNNGKTEHISGLYDFDSALAWVNMLYRSNNNRLLWRY